MTSTPRRPGIRLPWARDDDDLSESTDEAAQAQAEESASEHEVTTPGFLAEESWPSPAVGGRETSPSPLLASLVSAMREVADRERETSLAELRENVERQVEAMQERLAEEADDMRRRSELDVTGVGDWIREETERIRAEGERKVQARRQQLDEQLEDHEDNGRRETEALRKRLSDYELELATFFTQLGEIDDPAAFGAAAKRMPRPPIIAEAPPVAQVAEPAAPEPAAPEPAAPEPAAPEPAAPEPAAPEPAAPEPAAPDMTTSEPPAAEMAATAAVKDPADTAHDEGAADSATPAPPTADDSTTAAAHDPVLPPWATAAAPPVGEPTAAAEDDGATEHSARLAALGIDHDEADGMEMAPAPNEVKMPLIITRETTDEATSEGAAADAAEPQGDRLEARLAELDAKLAGHERDEAPATPVPPSVGEVATAVIVKGLGSFGAITSFKQALERVDGVRGISLSLGPTGEFVYRATHDPSFDLVSAIESIEQGGAQVERLPDGSLRVTVQRGR